ncbi:uncharacterized protein LOC124204012 isoform X3 [Daphnia pulex]|uniref:uncharacterized protein LOC124204012 isoform X3 n=1 Tax=Daphnia pulex TaxID=6669 RepID=UPI001EDD4105|nr:uncharacterized protein LOC124204012 isoform X3 [Daphnia pulex]
MSSLLAFGDFQLKTIPLALFYFLFAIQTECQQLEIIPGDTERVVQAGSHLTLTCTYQYVNEYDKRENNISWILPSYLTRNPKSGVEKRLLKTFNRNDTHLSSTMTLMNSIPEDTGYFGCVEILSWNTIGKISQYVYVHSDTTLIIDKMDDKYLFPKFEHRQGESLLIPCKPTHPNVTVSLSREKLSTNGEWDWDNITDLLSQPDSNWAFEPKLGMTLTNPKINDSGEYGCVGKMDNAVIYEYFSIYVLGRMELTRIDEIDDTLQAWLDGSNATFICRTSATSEFPSQPEWAYQIGDDGEMHVLNESNPTEGIHIQSTNYYSGMGYTFYESRLDLFDFASQIPFDPWNTSIIFKCTANIDTQPVSKTISLTIKEIRYDPVVYYVRSKGENNSTTVAFSVTLAILFAIGICIAVKPYFDKKRSGFREKVENNLESPIEEQTELITTSYDSQDNRQMNESSRDEFYSLNNTAQGINND